MKKQKTSGHNYLEERSFQNRFPDYADETEREELLEDGDKVCLRHNELKFQQRL